ncbi:MAG TPA: hypothetical protein DGG95_17350 [Cytophagales bacterium]|jgi:hypothetical protein|nr:hypothetical protein [Cytophagales bacterium]
MKKIMLIKRLSIFAFIALALSCTKEKVVSQSTAAETNAVLLAGAKGSSKSWKLTGITLKENSNAVQSASASDLPSCEADNVLTFSNNATQTYTQIENTLCTSTDPTTVEKGSWAFTDDGKTLLIDAFVYPTSTQFSDTNEPFLIFFILAQGVPLTVTSITDSTFTIAYTVTDSSNNNYYITVTFTKA